MLFQSLSDNLNLLISLLVGLLTFYLVSFYIKVFNLPKGPFPLPFIGNILVFYKTKVNQFITVTELHKKYGPVYTLWVGTSPVVMIGDYELGRKAFNSKNNELMGRPDIPIRNFIVQGNGYDVVFTDHGPIWASLRRVAHSAVRKLAINEKLSVLVDDVVNETAHLIIENNGYDKAFDPTSYVYMTVYNIIASSAFGKRYSWNDEELKLYENSFEYFRKYASSLTIPDRVPILKPFYYNTYRKLGLTLENLSNNVRAKYISRVGDHQKGVIRDFCDALIEAKEEAIIEEKESAPHLNDANLSLVILNLFFGGSDTTQYMLRWIILLMANNIQMQIKMRTEIDNNIGDRMATHEDRKDCPYVSAFIAETLRFRGVIPLGVPHRAMVDYKLDNFFIAKDSTVFVNLMHNSLDQRIWKDPEQFNPERFITKEGAFNSSFNGFTPFGIGRRVCLGEKLAVVDLFLITVRLLKSTPGCLIEIPGGDGSADLEPNPNVFLFCVPKPYEILLKKQ